MLVKAVDADVSGNCPHSVFIWDPRTGCRGECRRSLVQPSIDLASTLLRFFGEEPTEDMIGKDLAGVLRDDTPVRDAAIFGMHGAHVNITDGRHVYMRAPQNPENKPLFQYTLMPTHIRSMFAVNDFVDLQVGGPFTFTKGAQTMKIENGSWIARDRQFDTILWDTAADYHQETCIDNPEVEKKLQARMVELMRACDAPSEQFTRLGLPEN